MCVWCGENLEMYVCMKVVIFKRLKDGKLKGPLSYPREGIIITHGWQVSPKPMFFLVLYVLILLLLVLYNSATKRVWR